MTVAHALPDHSGVGAVCGHLAIGAAAEHVQVAVLEAVGAGGERLERRRLVRFDRGDGALEHRLRLLGRAALASRCDLIRGDEQPQKGHPGDRSGRTASANSSCKFPFDTWLQNHSAST